MRIGDIINQNYENYSYQTLCDLRDNINKDENPEEYSKLVELIYKRQNEKIEVINEIEESISTKPNYVKRTVAWIIDYSIIFGYFFYITSTFGIPNADGGSSVSGLPAFSIMLVWFIFTVIPETFLGATLGNYIVKLRPISIKSKETGISFGQSFKRHLLDVPDFWFFGLIAFLTIRNTTFNQRLGDIVAKTVVLDITDKEQFVRS
jgi:uncharacterized RDD family membrane protein YckC